MERSCEMFRSSLRTHVGRDVFRSTTIRAFICGMYSLMRVLRHQQIFPMSKGNNVAKRWTKKRSVRKKPREIWPNIRIPFKRSEKSVDHARKLNENDTRFHFSLYYCAEEYMSRGRNGTREKCAHITFAPSFAFYLAWHFERLHCDVGSWSNRFTMMHPLRMRLLCWTR